MAIRKDDIVVVMVGDDRGTQGKVLVCDRSGGKVVVEGVNRVYKHVRKSQRNPQGGRLSKEMPIPVANVRFVCTSCRKPTRLGARVQKDGSKERFCRKCGAGLGQVSPARQAKASGR